MGPRYLYWVKTSRLRSSRPPHPSSPSPSPLRTSESRRIPRRWLEEVQLESWGWTGWLVRADCVRYEECPETWRVLMMEENKQLFHSIHRAEDLSLPYMSGIGVIVYSLAKIILVLSLILWFYQSTIWTCHAMPCAKLWPNWIIIFHVRATSMFDEIWFIGS